MTTMTVGVRLTKGARIATKHFDYAVEYIPTGRPYALCIRFAPGGGPSLGEVVRVWFDDVTRVYSTGEVAL